VPFQIPLFAYLFLNSGWMLFLMKLMTSKRLCGEKETRSCWHGPWATGVY